MSCKESLLLNRHHTTNIEAQAFASGSRFSTNILQSKIIEWTAIDEKKSQNCYLSIQIFLSNI